MNALQTSRRALLSGSAALAIAPAITSPAHPDAELSRLCVAAHDAAADLVRFNKMLPDRRMTDEESDASDAECLELCRVQEAAINAVVAMPAQTMAGIRAKAAVTGESLEDGVREIKIWTYEEQASAHDMLARSLVNDILRLSGGAA